VRKCVLFLLAAAAVFGQKYDGPHPPKPDMIYLVHADNLIPTETMEARQEKMTFVIPGTSSPARTPLAEPIFIIDADKISPQNLELYKVDVKGGKREVTLSQHRTRGGTKALRLTVTPLEGRLYKIEADEELENGQYAITPQGSNTVFCFEIY
jgi:hypothetical protein